MTAIRGKGTSDDRLHSATSWLLPSSPHKLNCSQIYSPVVSQLGHLPKLCTDTRLDKTEGRWETSFIVSTSRFKSVINSHSVTMTLI